MTELTVYGEVYLIAVLSLLTVEMLKYAARRLASNADSCNCTCHV